MRGILEPLGSLEERLWMRPDRKLIVVHTDPRPDGFRLRGHMTKRGKAQQYVDAGLQVVYPADIPTTTSVLAAVAERACGLKVRGQGQRILDIDHPHNTMDRMHLGEFILDDRCDPPWPRHLNDVERKRVMGFPDGHVIDSHYRGQRQLGNAIVPAVARAILQVNRAAIGRSFRFIDLFCGIGGFHLACASVGGRCVFAADLDPDAAARYQDNFGMHALRDVTGVGVRDIPAHDVLCAGFPCQDFSLAGARETGSPGLRGARGGLFYEVVRIATTCQPRMLLLENVPRILTHDGGRTLAEIRSALDQAGYHMDCTVLNAALFGVPQARHRCWFVAWRHGEPPLSLPSPPGSRPGLPLGR